MDFVATMSRAAPVVVASTAIGQRRRTTRGAVASRVSVTESTPTGRFAATASSPLRWTPSDDNGARDPERQVDQRLGPRQPVASHAFTLGTPDRAGIGLQNEMAGALSVPGTARFWPPARRAAAAGASRVGASSPSSQASQ